MMATAIRPTGYREPEVLFVDDDPKYLDSVKAAADAQGYQVATAETAEIGMSMVHESNLAGVVCDLRMPGMGGVTLLEKIHAYAPNLPIAIQTGYILTDPERTRLKNIGALEYSKKVRVVELIKILLARAALAMGDLTKLQEEVRMLKALNQKLLAELKAGLLQIPNPTEAKIEDGLGGSYTVADLIRDIDEQNPRGCDFIDWWLRAKQRLRSMGKVV